MIATSATILSPISLPGDAQARVSIALADTTDLRPTLSLRPFDVEGHAPQDYAAAGLLERDVVQALARFDGLIVRSGMSSAGAYRPPQPADYDLEGRIEATPPVLTLRLRRADGHNIWVSRFPLKTGGLTRDERTELVHAIVGGIAFPYGALDEDIHARLRTGVALPLGLECLSHAVDFENRGDDGARRIAYSCLTGALSGSGDIVLPSILLADLQTQSYVANDTRLGAEPPLEAAEALALKAIAVGPERATSYRALAMILHLKGRKDEALDLARRALDINPFDANALATLGAIQIANGDYKGGAAVLKRVVADHPHFPSWIRFYLFLEAFMRADTEEQARIVAASDRPEAPLSILARALSAASVGNQEMAQDAYKRLRHTSPALAADPLGAFERMHLDAPLVARLAASVKSAGF